MGIKEQLKKSCSSVKKTVTEFTDSVKNEYKKGKLKDELSEMYQTLGEIRYSELINDTAANAETAHICEEITRIKTELENLKPAENDENEENKCSVCNKKIPNDISYCPYCGTKTENKE